MLNGSIYRVEARSTVRDQLFNSSKYSTTALSLADCDAHREAKRNAADSVLSDDFCGGA
jgi:hypothetical protein